MLNVKCNLCLIKWFGSLLVCFITVSTQNHSKLRKLKRVMPTTTKPISLQFVEFIDYNPSESVLIGHLYSYKNLALFNLSLRYPIINHPSAREVDTVFIHLERRVQLEFTMGQPIDLYRHLEEEKGATLSSLSSRAWLFIHFLSTITYLNVHAVFTEHILKYK